MTSVSAESIAALAAMLVVAVAFGAAARRSVPAVVGYLVAGALLGPHALGLLDVSQLHGLRPVTVAATGLLLVLIGEQLSIASFRAAPWIAVVAPLSWATTSAAVFFAVRATGASVVLAGLISVLGGGGAPMTVAAIVRGERVQTAYGRALVGLHAACDVLAALAFAVVFPLALLHAGRPAGLASLAGEVARLGLLGAVVGVACAASWRALTPRLPGGPVSSAAAAAHVATALGVSWAAGFSVPLAALAYGAVAASGRGGRAVRPLEPGLYVLVFALAGASIRFAALPSLGAAGAFYLLVRTASKLAAPQLAALVSALPRREAVRVGFGSLPHAGVSVALAAAAAAALPGRGIATITLGGIVIFELAGSIVVRAQLRREPAARLAPSRVEA